MPIPRPTEYDMTRDAETDYANQVKSGIPEQSTLLWIRRFAAAESELKELLAMLKRLRDRLQAFCGAVADVTDVSDDVDET